MNDTKFMNTCSFTKRFKKTNARSEVLQNLRSQLCDSFSNVDGKSSTTSSVGKRYDNVAIYQNFEKKNISGNTSDSRNLRFSSVTNFTSVRNLVSPSLISHMHYQTTLIKWYKQCSPPLLYTYLPFPTIQLSKIIHSFIDYHLTNPLGMLLFHKGFT